MAWTVSFAVIWSIPGVFGFLVWELTANWRLYAANRRRNLFPVRIGAHGETMARLLKPGFHSGTLPKRYAKLRRAERHARAGGNWHAVHKHLQALHRIEASIRRYVEREFLELFAESRCWQAPPLSLEHVRLGTNGVKLAIGCPGVAEAALQMALEVESGWLVAGVTAAGWVDRLLPHQRQVLATAIMGLYKSAGVDLVRQQIEAQFPPPAPWYDVSAAGLVFGPTAKRTWKCSTIFTTARGSPRSRSADWRGGCCRRSQGNNSSSPRCRCLGTTGWWFGARTWPARGTRGNPSPRCAYCRRSVALAPVIALRSVAQRRKSHVLTCRVAPSTPPYGSSVGVLRCDIEPTERPSPGLPRSGWPAYPAPFSGCVPTGPRGVGRLFI